MLTSGLEKEFICVPSVLQSGFEDNYMIKIACQNVKKNIVLCD